MDTPISLDKIKNYFEECLTAHGACPRGVDWNSEDAQEIRFDQLLEICHSDESFSILDYGCGYGALADYMFRKGYRFTYFGFDIARSMIVQARQLHEGRPDRTFSPDITTIPRVDYTVASGIFNICLEAGQQAWWSYVVHTLHQFDDQSRKGFAFNMLTKYSDAEHMRSELYYADPCVVFDYCKTHFSRNVALLHDYDLYDFTILVRRNAGGS